MTNTQFAHEYDAYIPEVDSLYVEFGEFDDIAKICKSLIFYPVYIAGLSGNGKTLMVEQICAKIKRKIVRVNITKNTDEDDLFGGFRLVNGETKWFEGPVVKAMKDGALLLLDEVDLGSINIMCLQPVLEGKGVLLKKIGQYISPAPGFNIIATANTKGRGNADGKFIGTNYMNEAFLERFAVTFEQQYPPAAIEVQILQKLWARSGIKDDNLIGDLIKFANTSRETYYRQGIDEVISTRRLVHIANSYIIFKDIDKAIDKCLNRFDATVKTALQQLWVSCRKPADAQVEEVVDAAINDLSGLKELEPL